MPLKPVFKKAPLMAKQYVAMHPGQVRADNAAAMKIYQLIRETSQPACLEGAVRLACILTDRPEEEPVFTTVREALEAQEDDGGFELSITDALATIRAAWAVFEFGAQRERAEAVARWLGWCAEHMDEVLETPAIRQNGADLIDLTLSFYAVTGKKAALAVMQRLRGACLDWSNILTTFSTRRPMYREAEPLEQGAATDEYRDRQLVANNAALLADGMRSAGLLGVYSGNAQECAAGKTGWQRISQWHGAVCGGTTADPLLEGQSPAELIDAASIGAWTEALALQAALTGEEWAWSALERITFNALSDADGRVWTRVNRLYRDLDGRDAHFAATEGPEQRTLALARLSRGWAAALSSAVVMTPDGADAAMLLPGRYRVPVGDSAALLSVTVKDDTAELRFRLKEPSAFPLRIRVPGWCDDYDVSLNETSVCPAVESGRILLNGPWHDGDALRVTIRGKLIVEEGYHQSKSVWVGPVLMGLPVSDGAFAYGLAEQPSLDGGRVTAGLAAVKGWKASCNQPGDVPVLPAADGAPQKAELVPWRGQDAVIAVFPGVKAK